MGECLDIENKTWTCKCGTVVSNNFFSVIAHIISNGCKGVN